jgi:hypothetical protein
MVRHRRGWLMLILAVTVVVYSAVVVVTGFLACGVSGCSGAGFGPVFAPVQAQVGLFSAGLCLVPVTVLLLPERPRGLRVAGAVGAVLVGSLLAMVLLGLGPNGCPWGYSRAVAGPDALSPGSLTCTADGKSSN